jgi:hypothetical protein
MSEQTKDFSIREEIKVVVEEAGLQLTEAQVDHVLDEVVQNEDLLSVISYFVKKEVREFAENNHMEYKTEDLNAEKEIQKVTLFDTF